VRLSQQFYQGQQKLRANQNKDPQTQQYIYSQTTIEGKDLTNLSLFSQMKMAEPLSLEYNFFKFRIAHGMHLPT
jgi:hypothetical protein